MQSIGTGKFYSVCYALFIFKMFRRTRSTEKSEMTRIKIKHKH